jgi:hypothetical protein
LPVCFGLRGALIILRERLLFDGNAVFFVSPLAKINELASFGAERAVRIILPLGGLATGWTLHRNEINKGSWTCCAAEAEPLIRPF